MGQDVLGYFYFLSFPMSRAPSISIGILHVPLPLAAALAPHPGCQPHAPVLGLTVPLDVAPGPGTTVVALGGPWWTHLVCPVSRAACREEEGRLELPASPTTGSVPAWSQSSALVPIPRSSPPLQKLVAVSTPGPPLELSLFCSPRPQV
jgi:hypothetical protein